MAELEWKRRSFEVKRSRNRGFRDLVVGMWFLRSQPILVSITVK